MSSTLELIFVFNIILQHFLTHNLPGLSMDAKLSHEFLMQNRRPKVRFLFAFSIRNLVHEVSFDLLGVLGLFFSVFLDLLI